MGKEKPKFDLDELRVAVEFIEEKGGLKSQRRLFKAILRVTGLNLTEDEVRQSLLKFKIPTKTKIQQPAGGLRLPPIKPSPTNKLPKPTVPVIDTSPNAGRNSEKKAATDLKKRVDEKIAARKIKQVNKVRASRTQFLANENDVQAIMAAGGPIMLNKQVRKKIANRNMRVLHKADRGCPIPILAFTCMGIYQWMEKMNRWFIHQGIVLGATSYLQYVDQALAHYSPEKRAEVANIVRQFLKPTITQYPFLT